MFRNCISESVISKISLVTYEKRKTYQVSDFNGKMLKTYDLYAEAMELVCRLLLVEKNPFCKIETLEETRQLGTITPIWSNPKLSGTSLYRIEHEMIVHSNYNS